MAPLTDRLGLGCGGVGARSGAAGELIEPAVEEQLQEIEGQHRDQEQCVQGLWGVPIDMFEVPVTSPLVEGGVPFYLFIDPIESRG